MKESIGDEYILILRPHIIISNALNLSESLNDFVVDGTKYPEISDLYLITDICITDYSSVMFDFANTKKPLLFFTYDLEFYKNKLRGFYFDFEKEAPGPLIKTNDGLIEAIKNIAKDFDFGEKIEVELFENIVENIYTIKENVNFKFPQANNINIAVLALEIIINEMTPNNNGVTKDDIAELLGFTERQGSYYGDLLVYLGFLSKDNSKYYPTKLSKEYKQETNRKEI